MAAGNRHLGVQGDAELDRGQVARREGCVLPGVPRADGAAARRATPPAAAGDLQRRANAAGRRPPATSARSVVCVEQVAQRTNPCPVEMVLSGEVAEASMTGTRSPPARRCCCSTRKKRRYLIELADDGEFHSARRLRRAHARSSASARASSCVRRKGSEYIALRPTLEDFVVEMPRGAQVIYPKDLGPICMLADIGPGVRVFESGIGSGALSMTMLRYGADIVGYEIREDFAEPGPQERRRASSARRRSIATTSHIADSYEGIDRRTARSTGSCSTSPSRGRSCPHAEARAAARRHPRGLHAVDHPGRPGPRGAARGSGSTPARSRCSIAAGTSRARRCDPTTAWSPTPRSSAWRDSSAATRTEAQGSM